MEPVTGRNHLLLCVLAGAILAAGNPVVSGFEGDDPEPSLPCIHEVVYEPFGGLILVSVTIADSPPLDFVLDSGATQSSLTDPFLARLLGLEVTEVGLARGVGPGAKRVAVVEDVCIRMDGVEVLRTPLVVHDIGVQLEEGAGREIDGFLGADFFARYVVEIDPANRRLLLYDPETFNYQGQGFEIPLEIVDSRPVVQATVIVEEGGKEIPVRLMVDTGSGRILALVTKSRRRLRPPSEQRVGASVGVVGETAVSLASTYEFRLGPVVGKRVETAWLGGHEVPGVRSIEDLNGILGNRFLSRVRVFLDYRGRRLILEPYVRDREGALQEP
jgi:hypothetical protein